MGVCVDEWVAILVSAGTYQFVKGITIIGLYSTLSIFIFYLFLSFAENSITDIKWSSKVQHYPCEMVNDEIISSTTRSGFSRSMDL